MILIAVALFAALSYAITSSGRGGGNVEKETMAIRASEILQYGALLRTTTDRLRLVNGCDLTELSFQADWDNDGSISGTSGDQHNTTSPSDKSCHYFDANGGGMSLVRKPSGMEDSDFRHGYRLHGNLSIAGFGDTVKSELLFIFRLQLTEANRRFCNALNKALNLPPDLSDGHNAQMLSYFSWGGNFGDSGNSSASVAGDDATELRGQLAGCYNAVGYDGGGYIFYYVMAAR